MKKENLATAAGFLPGVALLLIIAIDRLVLTQIIANTYIAEALVRTVPFILPMIPFLLWAGKDRIKNYRVKPFSRKAILYVVFLSLSSSIVSLLINSVISAIGYSDNTRVLFSVLDNTGYPSVFIPVLLVTLSAILIELFFCGCLMNTMEIYGGVAAIIIAAVSYAMVIGNIYTSLGIFLNGLVYGYLCISINSILPAVIAQIVNSLYYIVVGYWGVAFEALGFWQHFIFINILLLCLCLYISMRQMDKLLEKGKLGRIKFRGVINTAKGVFASPGLWMLIIIYIFRTAYS